MTDIIYRPFTAQDAPAVHQVALEAWHYTYQDLYDAAFIATFVQTHYAPGRLAALEPQVQSGTMFFEVAVHDAQIVGYCHIGITSRGAELLRLYVLPPYIGQGIGWGLVQRGEAFVVAQGFHTYGCFVHKDNELGKRFYMRRGFRHVGAQDHEEDWYMEKALASEAGVGALRSPVCPH
jgi:ribosomal protein S18 acetylase RimI-like enzyme